MKAGQEEITGKAYDSRLMKRLLGYVKPYKRYVFLAIVLNLIVAGLGPLRPYLTKIAIDTDIANGDFRGLLFISFLMFVALILQSIIQYGLTYYTQLMGQKIIYDIRVKLFVHIQKMALKFFDNTPVGRLVTRVTNDVEALNSLFSSGIVMIFSDVFILIWILIFMFTLSVKLSLVTLAVLPFLIYATFLFRKKVRIAYRNVRRQLARLNSFMHERITGINIVKLFAKEEEESENFSNINSVYMNAHIKSIFYYALFFPVVEIINSLAVALIIWYGGGKVIQSQITIGVLFAFIQFTEMFFRPIRDLSEKYNILQTALASSERIFKLLDTEITIKNNSTPIKPNKLRGEIEFQNVWFAYEENNYVLQDLSFKINPGKTVAIVGATGSGKTSIINLLLRLYDIQKGTIKIDGIDIKKFDIGTLRQYISVVLQDIFLFGGTIKSNITLDNENISEKAIREAAKSVGIEKLIEKFKNGFNEKVKESGASLSVGEKQLISFARALAYNPAILILDEATSSVDTETEFLIQKAIENMLKNRTSIVIAHRLSTIQKSDKILVMHKGRLREIGNHQELLAKRGIYYKLYQLQYKEQTILKTA